MKDTQNFNRNIYLDLFRYVLIFFIISIHYNSFSVFGSIFRVSVPMFFMISGFFNYSSDDEKQLKNCYKFIKSSFNYLIIGTFIYFAYDLLKSIFNNIAVKVVIDNFFYNNIIRDFLFFNLPNTSGGHLWFLICLFVCSLIHFLFVKFKKCNLYFIFSPILLIVSLLFSGYLHLFVDYNLPIEYTRNAIFMGMPMFSIGFLLGKLRYKKYNLKTILLFFCLGFGFLFLSLFESKILSLEFYISSIISSMFLLLFFNSLPTKECKLVLGYYKYVGKNAVFYIYILHVLIYNEFLRLLQINHFILCILNFGICFFIYIFFHIMRMYFLFLISNEQS